MQLLAFNGVSIFDVAPIYVTKVVPSNPEIKAVMTEKTAADGSIFVRKTYGPRTVTIFFYFQTDSKTLKSEYIEKLYAWAHSTTLKELRIPERPGKYINAYCSSLPDFSAVEQKRGMSIQFTCPDPYFYEDGERVAPIGTSFAIESVYGAGAARIEWTNPSTATSPAWVLDGATTITISGSVAAGAVVVQTNPIYATLADVSVMDQITIASRPFDLTYGAHTITGSGALVYRERWV